MVQGAPPDIPSRQQVGLQPPPPQSTRGGAGADVPGTPSTRASTPQPMEDQGVHPPQRGVISLTANGSAHGGRHFFATATSAEWRLAAAEERALEQHSLDSNNHPAALPGGAGRGGSAGLAALQLEGGAGPHHTAVWMVEDGGGSKPASQPPSRNGSRHGPGCGSRGGSRHGPGGGGREGSRHGPAREGSAKGGFGGATVKIEDPAEADMFEWGAYLGSLPKKLKGGLDTRLPIPTMRNIFWSWLGAFLGILAVSAMNQWLSPEIDIAFLVGSFGASAVLVFALLESKMSQPRNFLGGQVLSALVGITTRVVVHPVWIAGPLGMSLALVAMQLTATTHPPGGATALIACTMATLPKWHGYSYLVTVAVGSCVMQVIALVVNNLDPRRRYPTFWW